MSDTRRRVLVAALTISSSVLVSTAFKEGYRGEAYPDSATHGAPWTLGFGETSGVKPGDRTTPTRALAKLDQSLDRHRAGVVECLAGVELTQGEFDASVDLAYNIGVAAFCKSSVAQRFHNGDYWGGCLAMLQFTKARINGVLQDMPGLIKRRQDNYNTCVS